ncbi:CCR4-NOT transcription complex subunit 10-B [Clonorchis sinensis]|uniref:CCR4-NOT transcription complex subunit 10 n=1 Tax=Clonorchis sinensis TaxID=79923 RepID=H2KPG4_CLOSI|nr:CCR4-NOT transcription complex subunit 10-B [Clonorchis sinensis]
MHSPNIFCQHVSKPVQNRLVGYCKILLIAFHLDQISKHLGTLLPPVDLTPCGNLTICRRILLLWLEVLLHLQKAERVFELCGAWLVALSSLSLLSVSSTSPSTSKQVSASNRIDSTLVWDMLKAIRKPIQLFYIRACLLTGRLVAAEEELKMILSDEEGVANNASEEVRLKEPAATTQTEPTEVSQSEGAGSQHDSAKTSPGFNWTTGHCLQFLQAQLAYLKNIHSDAFRRLSNIPPPAQAPLETGHCESSLVWNNLALVHHRSGQFHLGGLQLRRALRETDKTVRDAVPQLRSGLSNGNHGRSVAQLLTGNKDILNQIPLRAFSLSQHHALLYNLGVQLLFARKPVAAFSTLLQLINSYPRNPRLWYRLAECCIKVHCPDNLSWWQPQARSSCLLETVGVGPCRNVMLTFGTREPSKPWIETASMPSPTLEFGSFCLRNALLLLPRPPTEISLSSQTDKSADDDQQTRLLKWSESQAVAVLPSPVPLRGLGLLHLMTAVHLGIAYTALCLNNPVDVLPSARALLEDTQCTTSNPVEPSDGGGTQTGYSTPNAIHLTWVAPSAYRFLARLYLAEALVSLDRVSEATLLLRFRIPDSVLSENQVPVIYSSSISLDSDSLQPCTNQNDPEHQLEHFNQGRDTKLRNQHSDEASPGQLTIYSPDFPRTGVQSTALLLYDLAATLAVDKQWTLAEHILHLSLSGLSLPVEDLNGHRWTSSTQSPLVSLCSSVLPLPAILLRIYLSLALNKSDQTLFLLREYFGHLTLAGRLHNPFNVPKKPVGMEPPALEKSRGWTMSDLRQLLKVSMNSGISQIAAGARGPVQSSQPNVQRPTSLWAPTQHFKQPLNAQTQPQATNYLPSLLQNQAAPSQIHAQYAGRWEQQSTSNQTQATGLITAANESDWPPL